MRKLPLALACALILGTPGAFAMGLGELQTQSYLNQPLRASIPITDLRPGDLDALSVKLGDEAQFARHGYSLMSVYGRIKLQVVGGAKPHILVTSDTPVRDPALGLVLELDGSSGKLERSVSILLDPEGYRPVAALKPVAASGTSSGTDLGLAATGHGVAKPATYRTPAQPMLDGGDYTAVSGDTAYSIARRVKPAGVGLQQTLEMIRQGNPHAFANPDDAGTLLAGKTLKIPNAQAMQTAKASSAGQKTQQGKVTPEPQARVAAATQDSRLDIVQPVSPSTAATPAVSTPAAPVVGEVVSGAASAGSAATASSAIASQAPAIPVEIQEQIEAGKVENERLTGLLASQDERLQKMEELLRLNETLIKDMEQKMRAATAAPTVPVAAPVEAAAPWWSSWLIGLGGLIAALLAYFAGSRRRAKDEPKPVAAQPTAVVLAKTEEAVVSEPAVVSPKAAPVVAAAVAGVAAADVIENAEDPLKAALEEADVMQAYGLHDRAIQVLSEALQEQPGHALLMARRARAMHEAGDADGFLREAQAFHEQHPLDEDHWAELSALGRAHYASSPLFAAGAADETSFWTAPAQNVDQDMNPDLIQPLDGLDLGDPTAVAEAYPSVALDIPPLEFDFPSAKPLSAVRETGASSAQSAGAGGVAEMTDDWAPLELPTSSVSSLMDLGEKDGYAAASESPVLSDADVSADDLATLGIDWSGQDVPAPISSEPLEPEYDFAEDRQAIEQASLEAPALDMDFIPLPLNDVRQEAPAMTLEPQDSLAAFEPLELPSLSLEPVAAQYSAPELSPEPLALDMDFTATNVDAPDESPRGLSLDIASAAPMTVMQESGFAPQTGMVSEHEVKIDIASAYLDMGDPLGAREMLQEVLASDCDELLKDRAQKMLLQIQA